MTRLALIALGFTLLASLTAADGGHSNHFRGGNFGAAYTNGRGWKNTHHGGVDFIGGAKLAGSATVYGSGGHGGGRHGGMGIHSGFGGRKIPETSVSNGFSQGNLYEDGMHSDDESEIGGMNANFDGDNNNEVKEMVTEFSDHEVDGMGHEVGDDKFDEDIMSDAFTMGMSIGDETSSEIIDREHGSKDRILGSQVPHASHGVDHGLSRSYHGGFNSATGSFVAHNFGSAFNDRFGPDFGSNNHRGFESNIVDGIGPIDKNGYFEGNGFKGYFGGFGIDGKDFFDQEFGNHFGDLKHGLVGHNGGHFGGYGSNNRVSSDHQFGHEFIGKKYQFGHNLGRGFESIGGRLSNSQGAFGHTRDYDFGGLGRTSAGKFNRHY